MTSGPSETIPPCFLHGGTPETWDFKSHPTLILATIQPTNLQETNNNDPRKSNPLELRILQV